MLFFFKTDTGFSFSPTNLDLYTIVQIQSGENTDNGIGWIMFQPVN